MKCREKGSPIRKDPYEDPNAIFLGKNSNQSHICLRDVRYLSTYIVLESPLSAILTATIGTVPSFG